MLVHLDLVKVIGHSGSHRMKVEKPSLGVAVTTLKLLLLIYRFQFLQY